MKEITKEQWNDNVFETIGKDWLLVCAKKGNQVNAMTASWGGTGIMWGKPVAFVFIRPQRYTKEFVDASQTLSLSVLPNEFRKELNYFGSVSGREEDKIAKSGLHINYCEEVPYFEEARVALICKKLYNQEMNEASFVDKSLVEKWYAAKDFHTMYVVELDKILQK